MPVEEFALHKRRHHTKRGFECGTCGAAFFTQNKLEEHQAERHIGPWYRCARCLKVYTDWESFETHVKNAGHRCPIRNPAYRPPPDSNSDPSESPSESTDRMHKRQCRVSTTSSRRSGPGEDPELHAHPDSAQKQCSHTGSPQQSHASGIAPDSDSDPDPDPDPEPDPPLSESELESDSDSELGSESEFQATAATTRGAPWPTSVSVSESSEGGN